MEQRTGIRLLCRTPTRRPGASDWESGPYGLTCADAAAVSAPTPNPAKNTGLGPWASTPRSEYQTRTVMRNPTTTPIQAGTTRYFMRLFGGAAIAPAMHPATKDGTPASQVTFARKERPRASPTRA